MRVAITGSSGFVGQPLCQTLTDAGHEVVRLVRRPARASDEVPWDPDRGQLSARALEGLDAVVNLAGAGLGDKWWTASYKRAILSSRLNATRLLAKTITRLDRPPRVLVSASGVNFYGTEMGAQVLDETSAPGPGFLAEVVRQWESAAAEAEEAGVRVCYIRSGPVMSRRGGALGRMLPFFRLGIGGPLGSGRQYWSPISMTDEVRAIRFLLETEATAGPYNLTSPQPVTNREFSRTLGRALRRPAIVPVPSAALWLVLGEYARYVLGSLRVMPTRLVSAGFRHQHPDIESLIRAALVD